MAQEYADRHKEPPSLPATIDIMAYAYQRICQGEDPSTVPMKAQWQADRSALLYVLCALADCVKPVARGSMKMKVEPSPEMPLLSTRMEPFMA